MENNTINTLIDLDFYYVICSKLNKYFIFTTVYLLSHNFTKLDLSIFFKSKCH